MTNFERFKQDFEGAFDSLNDAMECLEWSRCNNPFKKEFELVENLDQVGYDSYGQEDSYLGRVYLLANYGDILVLFEGKRQSHVGEEWTDFREVQKKIKTIEYYG